MLVLRYLSVTQHFGRRGSTHRYICEVAGHLAGNRSSSPKIGNLLFQLAICCSLPLEITVGPSEN